MESTNRKALPQRVKDAEAAVALLTTLFDQNDLCRFRPIETRMDLSQYSNAASPLRRLSNLRIG